MTQALTIVHECIDFNRWKTAYDGDAGNRKAAGLTQVMLARQADRPNNIALLFEVSDMAKARAFVNLPSLRDVMHKAGIIGAPDVHFRQGEFSSDAGEDILTINCRTSSIDTFKKGFAMDRADRVAAGLDDLAVLQDVGDPEDLLVCFAVSDVTRANAFLASPTLAEHQKKNAAVTSPPLVRYWKAQQGAAKSS
jgi:hypothetical protein